MNKELFERYLGKKVTIGIKPKYFRLTGTIDEVLDDCFLFTTEQKSSYINFDMVQALAIHSNNTQPRTE